MEGAFVNERSVGSLPLFGRRIVLFEIFLALEGGNSMARCVDQPHRLAQPVRQTRIQDVARQQLVLAYAELARTRPGDEEGRWGRGHEGPVEFGIAAEPLEEGRALA